MEKKEVRKLIYKKKQENLLNKLLVFLRVYDIEYIGTKTNLAFQPNTIRLYSARINKWNPLVYVVFINRVVFLFFYSILYGILSIVECFIVSVIDLYNEYKNSLKWHEWSLDDFKIKWK